MKKTTLISIMICSVVLNITACIKADSELFGKRIKGNGVFKELDRGKMEFTAIDVKSSVDVIISYETDAPIKVTGDENLVDYVETYVNNGVLNIHINSKLINSFTSKIGVKVIVPNNGHINSIKASGASDVKIEGTVVADHMRISCTGSSDFSGNVKANNFEMDCAGSSDFKGSIEAENCRINCAGSSDFKGSVYATTCSIKCVGSSDCNISGKVDVCEISMSGSSDFRGYDFIVNILNCNTSGSSDIQITCNGELSVRASGSSDIYYKGDAKVVSVTTTGSSSLVKK